MRQDMYSINALRALFHFGKMQYPSSSLSLTFSFLSGLSLQSMMMCNIGLYLELVSEEEDFGFRGRATIVHGGH